MSSLWSCQAEKQEPELLPGIRVVHDGEHVNSRPANSKGMLSQPTESIPYACTVWLPSAGRVHGASCPVQYPFTDGSCAVWGMSARSSVPEIWLASIKFLLHFYSPHRDHPVYHLVSLYVRVSARNWTRRETDA